MENNKNDLENIEVGKIIKKYRKNKKLTQKQLADLISKTESSVRKYEKGLVKIPFSALCQICDILDIPTIDLFPEKTKADFLKTTEILEKASEEYLKNGNKETLTNNLETVQNTLQETIKTLDTIRGKKHRRTNINLSEYENVQKILMDEVREKINLNFDLSSISESLFDEINSRTVISFNTFVFFISTTFPEYEQELSDKKDMEQLYDKVKNFAEFNIEKIINENIQKRQIHLNNKKTK